MKIINIFQTGDRQLFTTESDGYLPEEVKVWFEWTTDGPDPLVPQRSVVIRPAVVLCPEGARRFLRWPFGAKGREVKVINPSLDKYDSIEWFNEVLGPPRPPTQGWPRKEGAP